MAYYGEYASCQGRNERIYESPPISGYGYQQQPPRPPCDPCLNVSGSGYGVNQYGGQQIIPQGQIVRVCSKANPDYALAIRDGSAVMLFYNPNDPTMQWVKDESWSNQVRDQVGHPAFALVNKATGKWWNNNPMDVVYKAGLI